MKEPNYTAASNELREAYFKWRKKHPYIKASVMSFAAGWNASKHDSRLTSKKLSVN